MYSFSSGVEPLSSSFASLHHLFKSLFLHIFMVCPTSRNLYSTTWDLCFTSWKAYFTASNKVCTAGSRFMHGRLSVYARLAFELCTTVSRITQLRVETMPPMTSLHTFIKTFLHHAAIIPCSLFGIILSFNYLCQQETIKFVLNP